MSSDSIESTPESTPSIPALAAALRRTNDKETFTSTTQSLFTKPLAPLYRIDPSSTENEATSAASVVQQIIERLRRLSLAYAEWKDFDASAYFDLYEVQIQHLVHISERVGDVFITFFVDLLMPSFQRAERFWVEQFLPAYQCFYASLTRGYSGPIEISTDNMLSPALLVKRFSDEIQPQMVTHWQTALDVIQQTRLHLEDDIGFLSANGGQEERAQWRHLWRADPAPGLDLALTPGLRTLPTLTLSISFPMPTYRQPGRIRRLRSNRERRRRWHRRDLSGLD